MATGKPNASHSAGIREAMCARLRRGCRWRIEGQDEERARMAYATLAGDKLTYSIEQVS